MPSVAGEEPKASSRLLLVSNRLPITIKRTEDGQYDFTGSSGGLVTGLSGLAKTTTFQWYGWPGLEVPDAEAKPLVKRLKDEHGAHPVFVDDELADKHYNGFSNCSQKTIAKDVQDGDLIWVHDYHLMLLPEMLRDEIGTSKKNVKIGFFLHTPFPSSEIYRILPVRESLLLSVLHCDLIGFHTYDYARHFLSSCSRILETQTTPNGVEFRGKYVTVAAFPIGIDPKSSSKLSKSQKSKSALLN
ncbi:glycosyltransferase family 20 [Botrytis cinerea]